MQGRKAAMASRALAKGTATVSRPDRSCVASTASVPPAKAPEKHLLLRMGTHWCGLGLWAPQASPDTRAALGPPWESLLPALAAPRAGRIPEGLPIFKHFPLEHPSHLFSTAKYPTHLMMLLVKSSL